jgi:hypothetical protein
MNSHALVSPPAKAAITTNYRATGDWFRHRPGIPHGG